MARRSSGGRHKEPKKPRSPESRLYISRPLECDDDLAANRDTRVFCDRVGRSIKGVGEMRSLGSMAVTLMEARDYSKVRGRLTSRDRRRLSNNLEDFRSGLDETLGGQSSSAGFSIRGLALYGQNANFRRPGAWVALGFEGNASANTELTDDIDTIKSYFSDSSLPEPNLRPDKLHITVGRVKIHGLARGANKDPHVLVPSGLTVPEEAHLELPKVETING